MEPMNFLVVTAGMFHFSKYDFFKSNYLIQKAATVLKNHCHYPHNKKSLYNYLYRLASLASNSDLEIYLSAGVDIFEGFEKYLLDKDVDYFKAGKK